MRAALYARVSTDDQDEDLQLTELRAYARARGWAPVEYVDHGHSGRKARRPELDRLWADVRAGAVDVVVVWRFDRFGRSVSQLVRALDEFHERGVGFASLREALDTTTPLGKAMFTVIAAFAEFESSVIAERVRAGMASAKTRGAHVGRPCCNGLGDVAALVAAGESVGAVAARLGVHVTTVRRALRRARKAGVAA